MNIDALYGAENFAIKASHAMLVEFDNGNESPVVLLHVNHICRAYRIAQGATGAFFEIDISNHAYAIRV
jgi:hypothetical protein